MLFHMFPYTCVVGVNCHLCKPIFHWDYIHRNNFFSTQMLLIFWTNDSLLVCDKDLKVVVQYVISLIISPLIKISTSIIFCFPENCHCDVYVFAELWICLLKENLYHTHHWNDFFFSPLLKKYLLYFKNSY